MREPIVFGLYVPYSSLDSAGLANLAAGLSTNGHPREVASDHPDIEWYDGDFRTRYAQILLRERGL